MQEQKQDKGNGQRKYALYIAGAGLRSLWGWLGKICSEEYSLRPEPLPFQDDVRATESMIFPDRLIFETI